MFGKRGMTIPLVVDKTTDQVTKHFDLYFTATSTSIFFFSERELIKALRDTLTRAAWYGSLPGLLTLTDNVKLSNQIARLSAIVVKHIDPVGKTSHSKIGAGLWKNQLFYSQNSSVGTK